MGMNIMGYGLKTLANPSTAVTLQSGMYAVLPSGQYLIMLGKYSLLQWYDPVSLTWRNFNAIAAGSVFPNPDICKWMNQLGITKADEIIADNQPKCIYEIRQEGFNIKPTFKGPDSILAGIDILKRYPMRITKRSVNLIRELKNYKWKEDASGKPLNVPVDRFNHGIDGIRYACMGRMFMGNRIIKTSRHPL